MKQIIIYVLIITLIGSFTGCGPKKDKSDDTTTEGDNKEQVRDQDQDTTDTASDTQTTKDTRTPETVDSDNLPGEETVETDDSSDETTETASKPSTPEETLPDLSPRGEGIISYMEGKVDVTRNGKSLADELYEGYELENYDLIATGEGSTAEIEVYSSRCPETLITITENTVFSLEINKLESATNTTIDILAGSIAVKVAAITSDKELDVMTGEVTMGVRGTTFTVATLPTGDALVTCKTGKVECGDDAAGKSLMASPGKVVEKAGGGGMRRLDVPVEQSDEYLENWYDEKVRLLKNDALKEITKFVGEYETRVDQFDQAYADLMAEDDIINKWKSEDQKGKKGSTMEILREKKAIIGHIYEIQKILFWFKHVYYRLTQLKRYHDQGFGKGEIRPGYSTTDFFNSFSKADIAARLADLRYIFKLYAKRNDGSVPIGNTSEDDFFGNDDF